MTAFTKTRTDTAPPQARAGMLFPGLGHLLVGELVMGMGLMLLTVLWLLSGLTGGLRVPSLLVSGLVPAIQVSWVPLVLLAGLAGSLMAQTRLPEDAPFPLAAVAGLLFSWFGGMLAVVAGLTVPATLSALGLVGEDWLPFLDSWGASLVLSVVLAVVIAGATRSVRVAATAAILWLPLLLIGLANVGTPGWGDAMINGVDDAHGFLAVVSWVGLGAALWFIAFRRAWPRPLSDAEFNSNRQIFLRTMASHRTGMAGVFGVTFMMLAVALAPMIASFDPNLPDVGTKNLAPSAAYLMGTDNFGRDVFSRLLYGGRISLSIGFLAVTIAATLGTTIGSLAAYAGGRLDSVLMFVTDALLALPRLILLLTIVGLFRFSGVMGIFVIVVVLGATGWMGVARIVRSQVLSLKQQEFVQAATALGLSPTRVLFLHLIPNALAPVIVFCSLAIGSTMLAEAGLSFLGLGVPPPTSTWGVMVAEGRDPIRTAPHIAMFPGLAIMVSVLSFNLVGDGLRDAMDPKLRGKG